MDECASFSLLQLSGNKDFFPRNSFSDVASNLLWSRYAGFLFPPFFYI
uniref:Uncharacterized protein n=1 Tax=Setaria italica TaxID=4555 RepID=K3XUE9_SETIT